MIEIKQKQTLFWRITSYICGGIILFGGFHYFFTNPLIDKENSLIQGVAKTEQKMEAQLADRRIKKLQEENNQKLEDQQSAITQLEKTLKEKEDLITQQQILADTFQQKVLGEQKDLITQQKREMYCSNLIQETPDTGFLNYMHKNIIKFFETRWGDGRISAGEEAEYQKAKRMYDNYIQECGYPK